MTKVVKVLSLILLLSPVSSLGAEEIYSAVDPTVNIPKMDVQMKSLGPIKKPRIELKSNPRFVPKKVKTTRRTEHRKTHFEDVPSTHTDSISNRLRIIDQLIQRHQRAYDYRVHTTQELRAILARLDSEQKK